MECKDADCTRPSRALGYCTMHYRTFKKYGDPRGAAPGAKTTCSVKNCNRGGKIARGFCMTHYQRWKKWGDPLYVESQAITAPLPTCTYASCDKPARNHTSPYCEKHYKRVQRHGDAGIALKDHTPAIERWKTSYEVDDETGCWVWTKRGSTEDGNYGLISDGAAHSSIPAHKFVYEQLVGPIPEGLEFDHLCLNKACVNPEHLEPVPHDENARRAARNPTPGDDAHRQRIRETMRERRARFAADPRACNYCGGPLVGTFFKLCEDCRRKKQEARHRG